jgi:hypothetical protein
MTLGQFHDDELIFSPDTIIPMIDQSIEDHQRRLTDARSRSYSETNG